MIISGRVKISAVIKKNGFDEINNRLQDRCQETKRDVIISGDMHYKIPLWGLKNYFDKWSNDRHTHKTWTPCHRMALVVIKCGR